MAEKTAAPNAANEYPIFERQLIGLADIGFCPSWGMITSCPSWGKITSCPSWGKTQ